MTALLEHTMTADNMAVEKGRAKLDEDAIEKEPKQALRQAHRGLRRLKLDQYAKRREQMEQIAEALSEQRNGDVEAHLKQILHREQTNRDYREIRTITNKVIIQESLRGIKELHRTYIYSFISWVHLLVHVDINRKIRY